MKKMLIAQFYKDIACFILAISLGLGSLQGYAKAAENTNALVRQEIAPASTYLPLPKLFVELDYPGLVRVQNNPGYFRNNNHFRLIGFTRAEEANVDEALFSILWLNTAGIDYLTRKPWQPIGPNSSGQPFVLQITLLTQQMFGLAHATAFMDDHPHIAEHIAAHLLMDKAGLFNSRFVPVQMRFNGEEAGATILRETLSAHSLESRGLDYSALAFISANQADTQALLSPKGRGYDFVRSLGKLPAKSKTLVRTLLDTAGQKPNFASEMTDVEKLAALAALVDISGIAPKFINDNLEYALDYSAAQVTPVLFDLPIEPFTSQYDAKEPASCTLDFTHILAHDTLFQTSYKNTYSALEKALEHHHRLLKNGKKTTLWPKPLYSGISKVLTQIYSWHESHKQVALFNAKGSVSNCKPIDAHDFAHNNQAIAVSTEKNRKNTIFTIENKMSQPVDFIQISWKNENGKQGLINQWNNPELLSREILPDTVLSIPVSTKLLPAQSFISTYFTDKSGNIIEVKPIVKADLLGRPIVSCQAQKTDNLPAFIKLDKKNRRMKIPAGKYAIKTPLNIGYGWTLSIQAGAKLSFTQQSAITGCGNLFIKGTKEAPVIMQAAHKKSGFWPGIFLLNKRTSPRLQAVIEHAEISNIYAHRTKNWQALGGLMFRGYNIRLTDVRIHDVLGFSGTYIENSKLEADNIFIKRNTSKGLVLKNTVAKIDKLTMENINTPASLKAWPDNQSAFDKHGLNLVNSVTRLSNSHFANIDCEAIASKRDSILNANNIFVDNACAAILSIYGGQADFTNIDVRNIPGAAFKAYARKAGYKPGNVSVINPTTQNISTNCYSDRAATVMLKGKICSNTP